MTLIESFASFKTQLQRFLATTSSRANTFHDESIVHMTQTEWPNVYFFDISTTLIADGASPSTSKQRAFGASTSHHDKQGPSNTFFGFLKLEHGVERLCKPTMVITPDASQWMLEFKTWRDFIHPVLRPWITLHPVTRRFILTTFIKADPTSSNVVLESNFNTMSLLATQKDENLRAIYTASVEDSLNSWMNTIKTNQLTINANDANVVFWTYVEVELDLSTLETLPYCIVRLVEYVDKPRTHASCSRTPDDFLRTQSDLIKRMLENDTSGDKAIIHYIDQTSRVARWIDACDVDQHANTLSNTPGQNLQETRDIEWIRRGLSTYALDWDAFEIWFLTELILFDTLFIREDQWFAFIDAQLNPNRLFDTRDTSSVQRFVNTPYWSYVKRSMPPLFNTDEPHEHIAAAKIMSTAMSNDLVLIHKLCQFLSLRAPRNHRLGDSFWTDIAASQNMRHVGDDMLRVYVLREGNHPALSHVECVACYAFDRALGECISSPVHQRIMIHFPLQSWSPIIDTTPDVNELLAIYPNQNTALIDYMTRMVTHKSDTSNSHSTLDDSLQDDHRRAYAWINVKYRNRLLEWVNRQDRPFLRTHGDVLQIAKPIPPNVADLRVNVRGFRHDVLILHGDIWESHRSIDTTSPTARQISKHNGTKPGEQPHFQTYVHLPSGKLFYGAFIERQGDLGENPTYASLSKYASLQSKPQHALRADTSTLPVMKTEDFAKLQISPQSQALIPSEEIDMATQWQSTPYTFVIDEHVLQALVMSETDRRYYHTQLQSILRLLSNNDAAVMESIVVQETCNDHHGANGTPNQQYVQNPKIYSFSLTNNAFFGHAMPQVPYPKVLIDMAAMRDQNMDNVDPSELDFALSLDLITSRPSALLNTYPVDWNAIHAQTGAEPRRQFSPEINLWPLVITVPNEQAK